MKTYALYGSILAVASTLLTLLGYFTGLQTEHIGAGNYLLGLLSITHFVAVYLGVKEERSTRPEQRMTYGSALWGAVVISAVAAVLNSIYAYIHYTYINPDFAQYMINYVQGKMSAAGMPDNVIEQATSRMQNASAVKQAVQVGIGTLVFGFIYGLMLAPGQTQRGSITRIAVVNASVCGFFGLLLGAFNGFLDKTVGSSALLGLILVGGGAALVTFLLLKYTGYTPRFASEEST